jgi:hypothetical protein
MARVGIETPPYLSGELHVAWDDAEHDVVRAYSNWRALRSGDAYAAYLAALDREEAAAYAYAGATRT